MTAVTRDAKQSSESPDLRNLIEMFPGMVVCVLPDGSAEFANHAWQEYAGCSMQQLSGRDWQAVIHPQDVNKLLDEWSADQAAGKPFEIEARMRRADGQYRWFLIKKAPALSQLKSGEQFTPAVIAFEDINERRETERRLRELTAELARVSRLTTMGELAASIAHEVNQPLTAVLNNGNACLRLLADRNLEPEVLRRALEGIVADGTRASTVLARIRAFIKKEPAEKNEVDINEVIREVLVLAGRELDEMRVSLDHQLTADLPFVSADRVELQQVLLNLIMNGIEAMAAVTNRSRLLAVHSRIDDAGDVLVAISDSGTGFDFEMDRVFTPFFTTKVNGLGMGLSISRSLVENHGGRLWATPNSPHGAVFSFTLPASGGSSS